MGWTKDDLDKLPLVKGDDGILRAKTREERGMNLLLRPESKIYNAAKTESGYGGSLVMRSISLCLFGEPMPKQSVRSFATGAKTASGKHIISHYQPKEMGQRVKDYQRQLKEQLPADFVPFTTIVHIRKLHFVFSPLKSFSKNKMERIAKGELFYKTTKPDVDNLQKIFYDSLNEIVFKDDAIVASVSDMKKIYGTGGCIIITLEGY